jgi:hypothetical protein
VINSNEAYERHAKFLKKLNWTSETDSTNILHPWKHSGEIWLTDLLFRRAKISSSITNELLGAFANGRISIIDGPLQFSNSKEMIKLLDIAAKNDAVSYSHFRIRIHLS